MKDWCEEKKRNRVATLKCCCRCHVLNSASEKRDSNSCFKKGVDDLWETFDEHDRSALYSTDHAQEPHNYIPIRIQKKYKQHHTEKQKMNLNRSISDAKF